VDSKVFRWNKTDSYTLSVGLIGDCRCHFIERPWIDDGTPGGKSFESCIPDGLYDLEPFTRPNGDEVYRLVNEQLGVYRNEQDVPGDTREEKRQHGRWLILWHFGNYVADVVGCAAPGTGQAWKSKGVPMVTHSKRAMGEIMERLDQHFSNRVYIATI